MSQPALVHGAARAAGIVAWGLAASSVVWGLALSTRACGRTLSRAWLYDLHRFLGGLAVAFTLIHVVAVVADTTLPFGPAGVLVPLLGRGAAAAWGIAALYLLLAVELTSLARVRLPARLWRRVHAASAAVFVTATAHTLTARPGPPAPLVAVVLGACGLVAALTALRLVRGRARAPLPPGRVLRLPRAARSAGERGRSPLRHRSA